MKVLKFNYLDQTYREFKNTNNFIILNDNYHNFWEIKFIKNGKIHNSNGYGVYSFRDKTNIGNYYCYNGMLEYIQYNIKKWKKIVKLLKREDALKVFI